VLVHANHHCLFGIAVERLVALIAVVVNIFVKDLKTHLSLYPLQILSILRLLMLEFADDPGQSDAVAAFFDAIV
jgi:hypothetical protein